MYLGMLFIRIPNQMSFFQVVTCTCNLFCELANEVWEFAEDCIFSKICNLQFAI